MAGGKWKIAAVAAALIVVASSTLWYFESPAWTLKGMKDAAQSHDADALNAYIDYPALRDSLKAELTARMRAEARKDKSGFGALGMAFGSAMMGPMIDATGLPRGDARSLACKQSRGCAAGGFGAPYSRGARHCEAQLFRVSRDRKEPAEHWPRVQEAWPFLDAQRRRIATDRVEVSAGVQQHQNDPRGKVRRLVASGGFPSRLFGGRIGFAGPLRIRGTSTFSPFFPRPAYAVSPCPNFSPMFATTPPLAGIDRPQPQLKSAPAIWDRGLASGEFQIVAPGHHLELASNRVVDGNDGSRLKLERRQHRGELVHFDGIVAIGQHVAAPIADPDDEHLYGEVRRPLPFAKDVKNALLSPLIFDRRPLRAFIPSDHIFHGITPGGWSSCAKAIPTRRVLALLRCAELHPPLKAT